MRKLWMMVVLAMLVYGLSMMPKSQIERASGRLGDDLALGFGWAAQALRSPVARAAEHAGVEALTPFWRDVQAEWQHLLTRGGDAPVPKGGRSLPMLSPSAMTDF